MVLKGAALAHGAYPNPAVRPFTDLDVLVTGDRHDEATRALEAYGYHRSRPEPAPGYDARIGKALTLVHPGGVVIDLHRTLVPGLAGASIDVDEIIEARREVTVNGRPVPAPSWDAHFVEVCLHAAVGDGLGRALSVRDVAQVLTHPELDVGHALELSRRWKVTPIVGTAVPRDGRGVRHRTPGRAGAARGEADRRRTAGRRVRAFVPVTAGRAARRRHPPPAGGRAVPRRAVARVPALHLRRGPLHRRSLRAAVAHPLPPFARRPGPDPDPADAIDDPAPLVARSGRAGRARRCAPGPDRRARHGQPAPRPVDTAIGARRRAPAAHDGRTRPVRHDLARAGRGGGDEDRRGRRTRRRVAVGGGDAAAAEPPAALGRGPPARPRTPSAPSPVRRRPGRGAATVAARGERRRGGGRASADHRHPVSRSGSGAPMCVGGILALLAATCLAARRRRLERRGARAARRHPLRDVAVAPPRAHPARPKRGSVAGW